MQPIPTKLRNELAADPYYRRCCYTGSVNVKIEWHHNLIYAGKQVQEKWCILPISAEVHRNARHPLVKQKLDWIMLNRATEEELGRYSKVTNLILERERLNRIYAKKV